MTRTRAALQARLEAIEILLLWEGRVSRARLLDFFEIHSTHASRALAACRDAYPEACVPDMSTKSYLASRWMRPQITKGQFNEYQKLVGAVGAGKEVIADVPIETTYQDATQISFGLFSKLHAAMRMHQAIIVRYRSMKNPKPHDRVIHPHSLIQSGPRWHVRAYCEKVSDFRDFNLGRIMDVAPASTADARSDKDDSAWHTNVKVRLVPHRDHSVEQSQMVRDEYMGGTAALVFVVRVPLIKYLVQSFRAAMDPDRQRAPEYLLMVKDPEKLPKSAHCI